MKDNSDKPAETFAISNSRVSVVMADWNGEDQVYVFAHTDDPSVGLGPPKIDGFAFTEIKVPWWRMLWWRLTGGVGRGMLRMWRRDGG